VLKVLFIGGTGLISTACAHRCVEQGMELFLLVRGTRDHRAPSQAHILHGDITADPAAVRALLDRHRWDVVVDWVAYREADVQRDIELFLGKTKQFIFISSTSVYRKPLSSAWVDETTPIGNRFWDYADQKARCEQWLLAAHRSRGFPVVIVRPGATYAEFTLPTGIAGMGFGMVERMRAGKPVLLHGDGTGLWTFTFNEDFARAFVPLLGRESVVGETFQITSDEVLSWRNIYDTIGEVFGCAPQYVCAPSQLIQRFDAELGATLLGDKSHSYLFHNRKIKQVVPSFASQISLCDGLRRCERWYRHHQHDVVIDARKDQLLDDIIRYVEQELPADAAGQRV
jgi:nucleoside-diphosphate-sugar epimerase